MKSIPLDQNQQNLYKSHEFAPLPKMAIEVGTKNTISILNRLEFIENLTRPRNLSWLGADVDVVAMDVETALFIRDDPVCSSVRKLAHEGQAHQYGDVLLSGKHAPEPLIGAGSAIAHVEQNEQGDIKIIRKKELGIENKHAADLIKEFHDLRHLSGKSEEEDSVDFSQTDDELDVLSESDEATEHVPWETDDLITEDSDVARMKLITEENKTLKKEKLPSLKGSTEDSGEDDYKVPW